MIAADKFLNWRRLADELAVWSWWRFVAICIAILIAGAILDDLLIGREGPRVRATASTHERAHKAPPAPAVPPAAADKGGPESTPARPAKPSDAKADSEQTSISVAIGGQDEPVRIDVRGAKDNKDLQKLIKEIKGDVADAGTDDEASFDVLADQRAGWKNEPFYYLAKLVCVVLLILKVIGGTRRERMAREAAAAAGAASVVAQQERELAQMRLRQMQAQIEPHFLFNTLAALQRLITTAPDRAATMNRHLIDWLRGSLAEMRRDKTNLGNEADLLRSYFSLMQVRFEERLNWEIDIPDGVRAETIPALLLQPLVENAISHGIEPKAEGGRVRVSARLENRWLRIAVEDSGVGFSAQAQPSGIGLSSVRERLRLGYGDRAKLTIRARDGGGTVVEIMIPAA